MSATQSEVEALSSREVMIFELSGLLLALPERVCRAAVHTALETIAAASEAGAVWRQLESE